jgi:hypothetical protein
MDSEPHTSDELLLLCAFHGELRANWDEESFVWSQEVGRNFVAWRLSMKKEVRGSCTCSIRVFPGLRSQTWGTILLHAQVSMIACPETM